MSRTTLDKKGFTLVEVLIVIMIVGVLSTLAVGGYTQYRKNALLNLAADNLIAQINELREKTVYGLIDEEGDQTAKCYGFYFDNGAVYQFALNYQSKKVWNISSGTFEEAGCEKFETSTPKESFDFGDQILVTGLHQLNGIKFRLERILEQVVVLFEPPKGEIKVFELSDGELFSKSSLLKFDIVYGNDPEDTNTRSVIIDLKSGKASTANFLNEITEE